MKPEESCSGDEHGKKEEKKVNRKIARARSKIKIFAFLAGLRVRLFGEIMIKPDRIVPPSVPYCGRAM